MTARPVIGIVGSAGAYGRWLARFFRERMRLEVIGHDPADALSLPPNDLAERADVLVFSVPIRATAQVIGQYRDLCAGREADKLWLDLTSIKAEPISAMLASRAEVVGLHPMTAAPKASTLKGRVLVVCEARLARWRAWVGELLAALQAEVVHSDGERHDRIMALVQAMVHAGHLAQASVLREYASDLGGLEALLPFRSTSFELDSAVIARILALNPAIYEDIQFGNRHVAPMLARMRRHLQELESLVERGDDAARARFRSGFLDGNRQAVGERAIAAGNHQFERLGYLLADLTARRHLSVYLPRDEAGSLRVLLEVFERAGLSIDSIHSSRTPGGEVHFRFGFADDADPSALADVAGRIDDSGIGRVLDV